MIDEFNSIKNFLKFETSDDFYFLQSLQRKKDGNNIGSDSRVIKNYYINSVEYLNEHYEEIKDLCNKFNARAMLRLNKRSYRKASLLALKKIADYIWNNEYRAARNSFDSACGEINNEKTKLWIVDIDKPYGSNHILEVSDFINKLPPFGGVSKIILELTTSNGCHIITTPFDLSKFKTKFPNIDVHKDNPINLYIP
jgi:hypothetical protein